MAVPWNGHTAMKKRNVQPHVNYTEESQNSVEQKVTKYTKTSLYKHEKPANENNLVFRTHALMADCNGK